MSIDMVAVAADLRKATFNTKVAITRDFLTAGGMKSILPISTRIIIHLNKLFGVQIFERWAETNPRGIADFFDSIVDCIDSEELPESILRHFLVTCVEYGWSPEDTGGGS